MSKELKMLIALSLCLVLVLAFGVTTYAAGHYEYVPGTSESSGYYVYAAEYAEAAGEKDVPSDDFVKSPALAETAAEPNPDTGLRF